MMSPRHARTSLPAWTAITAVSGGFLLIALCAALAVMVRRNPQPGADALWFDAMAVVREHVPFGPALVLNVVGGTIGTVLLVACLVVLLAVTTHRFGASFYLLLSLTISFSVLQIFKRVVARDRPPEMTVGSDFGSFPSGHVTCAIAIIVALGLVVGRVWVWIVGIVYGVVMMVSRTFLNAHWLTDVTGGIMLGAAGPLLALGICAGGAAWLRNRGQGESAATIAPKLLLPE